MTNKDFNEINGLGDENADVNVYIQNRPTFGFEHNQRAVYPLKKGEIYALGQACGNGWRKVFNVYAKLLYALPNKCFEFNNAYASWQQYRDEELLQSRSKTALWFSPPKFQQTNKLHIVMGRTYAKSLSLPNTLEWINPEFAIDLHRRLIVCPYFDYRQLSNSKIIFLVDLIAENFTKK
ncbi:hypothetical protein [Alteromonas sp. M12]|uniref:DUF6942 family protein n=1 Tax=Alteromonas sp. M12 TaxID=3135644 RepID=UPI00319DD9C3